MNLPEIGSLIRQARKAAKQSQAALAHSLGMSRATVSAIENGTVGEIGIRKVMALCAALGLELNAAPKRRRPTLDEVREENGLLPLGHRGGSLSEAKAMKLLDGLASSVYEAISKVRKELQKPLERTRSMLK